MSREVLGTRGDAEPETAGVPVPTPGTGRRADLSLAENLDVAPGLDVPPGAGPGGASGHGQDGDLRTAAATAGSGEDPTTRPGPSRPLLSGQLLSGQPLSGPLLSGRRPLLAAALAGAVLGGVLAVGITQRAELQEAQSTASVHAWAELGTERSSADTIALTLRVLNTGDAPLTVLDAGMDGGLQEDGPVSAVVADEVTVPPRTMAAVPMEAQADCSGPPLAENGSRDGRLQLRLRTADGREQLVEPPTGGISLTSADVQEAFCGQTGLRLGVSVAQMATTPSGGLSMSLLNDAREPASLDFSAPRGTRIVGEPALPVVVEPSRRISLSIALEVDACTGDAQRVEAGDLVQLVIDGRARRGGLDSALVNAWVAREVALACS